MSLLKFTNYDNIEKSQVMEVVMSREDDALIFGVGILAGVATGIIAGLLLAPDSGLNTRKKLQLQAEDFAKNCVPTVEEAKRQALATADVIQFKIEKAINSVNDSIKARQLAKAKDKEHSVYGI